jgi:hypothetical protein
MKFIINYRQRLTKCKRAGLKIKHSTLFRSLICFVCLVVVLLMHLDAKCQSPVIPTFTFFKAQGGENFTEKNLKPGKECLFVFFDISCSHCQEAMKAFNKNAKKLSLTSMYLVTLDSKSSAQQFLSTYAADLWHRKNVMVLLDRYNEFINKFQPKKYPSIFLYSESKKLKLYSDEPTDVPKFLALIEKNK